jgi:ELWxxDGT repeat protein
MEFDLTSGDALELKSRIDSIQIVDRTDVLRIVGGEDAPVTGNLSKDAYFSVIVGTDGQPVDVYVPYTSTRDNLTIDMLLLDINEAIAAATLPDGSNANLDVAVKAVRDGNRIVLESLGTLIQLNSGAGNATSEILNFATSMTGRGELAALTPAPANGQIDLVDGNADFRIRLNGGREYAFTLLASDTVGNTSVSDLVDQLNSLLATVRDSDDNFARLELYVQFGATSEGALTLTSLTNSIQFISQFGIYVDSDSGELRNNDGGGIYELEDTGLNRVLGGIYDDNLYGGTGLDFLYGNGGDDTLWRADGTAMNSADGGLAGDEWKQYAQETDKVWYYRGTNADDVISVDYVTEPGLLGGTHLITRLTNNNGNFSFDAQVKLDFSATDSSGNPIYNDLPVGTLPPEDDFLAIIVDALRGDDIINIGPTVQVSIWTDAGAGNDVVNTMSGNSILPDITEQGGRNDTPESGYSLGRAWLVAANTPSALNYRLTDADDGHAPSLNLRVNGQDSVTVTLSGTDDNIEAVNLLDDINLGLANAGLSSRLVAMMLGGKISIGPTAGSDVVALEVYAGEGSASALSELGFTNGAFIGQAALIGQDTAAVLTGDTALATAVTGDGALIINLNGTRYTMNLVGTAANVTTGDLIDKLNDALISANEVGGGAIDLSGLLSFGLAGDFVQLLPVTTTSVLSLSMEAGTIATAIGFTAEASASYVEGVLATNGVLSADAIFDISVSGSQLRTLTVTAEATADNLTAADLALDIQAALVELGLGNQLRAEVLNGRLRLVTLDGGSRASIVVQVSEDNTARTELHLLNNQTALSSLLITSNLVLTNLTIDNADDVDWYSFTLASAPGAGDVIRLTSASPLDGLRLAIFEAGGDAPFNEDQPPQGITPDGPDLEGGNDIVGDAYTLAQIDSYNKVFGLTLHSAADVDWFRFSLEEDGTVSDRISILIGDEVTVETEVRFELFDADGNSVLNADGTARVFSGLVTEEQAYYHFSLEDLEAGDYTIKVSSEDPADGTPISYQLYTSIGETGYVQRDLSGQSESAISLDGLEAGVAYLLRVTSPNLVPTIYNLEFEIGSSEHLTQDMATRPDQVRRDVIIGGFGDDRLQGGSGEDWIFGIAGSNVISGGYDEGAPDLLFGGTGNDTFQIMPDELPKLNNSEATFIPTFNDIMQGGDGEDRVLFLGGDLDNLGREVPDFGALRFNSLLGRWEFTSMVWDTANQEFMMSTIPGSVVTAIGSGPVDGRLDSDFTFIIELGGVRYEVTVPAEETRGEIIAADAPTLSALTGDIQFEVSFGPGDTTVVDVAFGDTAPADLADLITALNDAVRSTLLSGQVEFVENAGKLMLQPARILSTNLITLDGDILGLGFAALDAGDSLVSANLNNGARDLAEDIQNAFRTATLEGTSTIVDITDLVTVGVRNGRFVFLNTEISLADALILEDAELLGFQERQEPDAGRPIFDQHYYFFMAFGIENFVIDLQRGDDVFHADPEFTFLNQVDEWGVKAGAGQQGGGNLVNLTIIGGDGNDILYGGAFDDEIFGGAGYDYLAGGPGDDVLDGGSGNDLLAGNSSTPFDIYEIVEVGGVTGHNDTAAYAALLPEISSGMIIDGLTFNEGDRADFFLIRTPEALKEFSGAVSALLLREMLSLDFDDPAMQTLFERFAGSHLSLFAARDLDPSSVVEAVPVEQFAGVPEYYILKVVNVAAFTVMGESAPISNGRLSGNATFEISINGGTATSVTIAKADTDANIDIQSLRLNLENALSAANLNGLFKAEVLQSALGLRLGLTAAYDFTFSLTYAADNAAVELGFRSGQNNLLRAPEMGQYKITIDENLSATVQLDGDDAGAVLLVVGSDQDATLASFRPVSIFLGDIDGDGIGDYVAAVSDDLVNGRSTVMILSGVEDFAELELGANSSRRFIVLPAPLLSVATDGSQASFLQPADYNNDGLSDIGILVSGNDPQVYIIGGSAEDAPEVVDAIAAADIIIQGDNDTFGAQSSVNPEVDPQDDSVGHDSLVLWQGSSFYVVDGANLTNSAGDFSNIGSTAVGFEGGQILSPIDFSNQDFDTASIGGAGSDITTELVDTLRNPWSIIVAPTSVDFGSGKVLHFGNSTYTGYSNSGEETGGIAQLLELRGGSSGTLITFDSFLATEGYPVAYDQAFVEVRSGTGDWTIVASSLGGSNQVTLFDGSGSQKVSIQLNGSYSSDLDIRFRFVTNDGVANNFHGWSIDNVEVYALAAVDPAKPAQYASTTEIVAFNSTSNSNISLTFESDSDTDVKNLWKVTTLLDHLRGDGTGLYFGFADNVVGDNDWTYDNDSRVFGRAILSGLTVGPGGALLSFDSFLRTEGFPTDFDQAVVEIRKAGGSWQTVASNAGGANIVTLMDPAGTESQRVGIELDSTYVGDIEIRFSFDSIDEEENAFEGWSIDNVRVDAFLTLGDLTAEDVSAYIPTTPGAIGHILTAGGAGQIQAGYTKGSVVVVTESNLLIYDAADLLDPRFNPNTVTEDYTASFAGVVAGLVDLGDVTNDGYNDFALNGNLSNSLYSYNGVTFDDITTNQGGIFVALGDLDNDGVNDFGRITAKATQTLIGEAQWSSTEDVTEQSQTLYHNVAEVFLSGGLISEFADLDLDRPSFSFEQNTPGYRAVPNFSDTQFMLSAFNHVADTDDNTNDGNTLVVAEMLGSELSYFDADDLGEAPEPEDLSFLRELPKVFRFPLAFPNYDVTDSTSYTGIDIGDIVTGINLSDAIAFEGDRVGMELSMAQQLGDFDGDGHADTLLQGPDYAFLLLGAVQTLGLQQASVFADYLFDLDTLGRPAERMGDLNADGLTDLVFFRHDDSTNSTIITIIFGGQVYPRTISAGDLAPDYSRVITLSQGELNTANGGVDAQVMAARWSGHYNAQDELYFDDLVVISPVANAVNSYGYVFAGDVIRDFGGNNAMDSSSALADLRLFTTEVSSGNIDAAFPTRNFYLNTNKETFAPKSTTATGTAGDATTSTQEETSNIDLAAATYNLTAGSSQNWWSTTTTIPLGSGAGTALYFGNTATLTYANGASRVGGYATYSNISTGVDSSELTFNSYLQTENFPAVYDIAWVEVRSVGTNTWTRVASNSSGQLLETGAQQAITINLDSSFAGAVDIRFGFDSGDGVLNDFQGWVIDDLQVVSDQQVVTSTVTDINIVVTGNPTNALVTDADLVISSLSTGNLSGLKVELLHQDGTSTVLFNGQGGTATSLLPTIFNQESSFPVAYLNTFISNLQAAGDMNVFNGKTANGTWKLRVTDSTAEGVANDFNVELRLRTNEPITSTIVVPVTPEIAEEVTDVVLSVQFVHPQGSDLSLRLTNPDGTVVNLPSLSDWGDVTLNDQGLTSYTLAATMADFFGEAYSGTWTLTIVDNQGNFDGTLESWSLDLATTPTEVSQIVKDLPLSPVDLNVNIRLKDNLDDPRPLDLSGVSIDLVGPTGVRVTLFNTGDVSGHVLGTALRFATFDDEALTMLADAASPYSGLFNASGNLSDFNGLNPNGSWTLEVTDHSGNISGLVDSWSLEFSFAPIDGQALQASVVGDVNGDGLDDLGFVVRAFVGEESVDPAQGQAFILGGRDLPNNNGQGRIISSSNGLSNSDIVAEVIVSGGTNSTRASVILSIGGADNNLLIRALNNGTAPNNYEIEVLYDSSIAEGVEVSSTSSKLTIRIRDDQVAANAVVDKLAFSTGADAFRALFAASLYVEAEASLFTDSIWQTRGTSLGGSIQALGDIDQDGADDFALVRYREDAASARAGVLLYKGDLAWRQTGVEAVDAYTSAFVRFTQATEGEFGTTSFFSSLQVTAGDFNGDGVYDLAIGRTEFARVSGQQDNYTDTQILNTGTTGAAFLFFSIADNTIQSLAFRDAHLILEGQNETDRFGTLTRTPGMDINADGIDDLFIGAATAASTIDGTRIDAGRLYMIYGSRLIQEIPDRGFDILTNRSIAGLGSFLVDTGIGRPYAFYDADLNENGILDSSRYTLLPGESYKWYRFSTLGDGALGDMLRLDPISGVQTETVVKGFSGVLTETAPDTYSVNLSGLGVTLQNASDIAVIEFDLSAYLGAIDDPEILKQVTLRIAGLSSEEVNLPTGIERIVKNGTEIFFTARDSQGVASLWVSDGTPFGTLKISDLVGLDNDLVANGDRIFVVALTNGRYNLLEVNESRTALNVVVSGAALTPTSMVSNDDDLYFLLGDVAYHVSGNDTPVVVSGMSAATALFYTGSATDSFYAVSGNRVWLLNDGSSTSITRSIGFSDASGLALAGEHVFFTAASNGIPVVWASRLTGTGANGGATELTDGIYNMASLSEVVHVDDVTYMIGTTTQGVRSLYILDADGFTFSAAPNAPTNPSSLTKLDNDSLALVGGSTGNKIVIYDPSDTAANPTVHTTGATDIQNLFSTTGSDFLFAGRTAGHGLELWKLVSGTASRIADIHTGASDSAPAEFTLYQGSYYFSAETSSYGRELYSTNLTNVVFARDVFVGARSGQVSDLTVVDAGTASTADDILFFRAVDSDSGTFEIFSFTGTANTITVDPIGADNALTFTKSNLNGGETVRFESGSTLGHLETTAGLVVTVIGGTTTAAGLIAYFDGLSSSDWSVALNATLDASNDGSGYIMASDGTFSGGTVSSPAALTIQLPGSTDTVEISSSSTSNVTVSSIKLNLVSVNSSTVDDNRFDSDTNVAAVSWVNSSKTLTIQYRAGVTTMADIVREINTEISQLDAVFVTANTTNFVSEPYYAMTGGNSSIQRVVFGAVELVFQKATGAERRIVFEETTHQGTATSASYNSSTATTTIYITSGTSTATNVKAAMDGVTTDNLTLTFTGLGSTVLRIPQLVEATNGTFSGGVDQVAATATLNLGGGNSLNLTAATAGTDAHSFNVRVLASYDNGSGTNLTAGTPVVVLRTGTDPNYLFTVYALPGEASVGDIRVALNGLSEMSATLVTGSSNADVVALPEVILSNGQNYEAHLGTFTVEGFDFTFTATAAASMLVHTPTATFDIVDASADRALASLTGNELVVQLRSDDTTTVAELLAALNTITGYTVTTSETTTALVEQSGGVQKSYTVNDAGQAATAASGTYTIGGQTLTVTADTAGSAANGTVVVFRGDATSTLSSSWDATDDVLTISYVSGTSTLENLRAAINGNTSANLTASGGTTATVVANKTATFANGVDAVAATATIAMPSGDHLILKAQDTNGGATFNTRTVAFNSGSAVAATLSSGAYVITVVENSTQRTTAALTTALSARNITATSFAGGTDALYVIRQGSSAATTGTNGTATLTAPGSLNDIEISAPGSYNTYKVIYVDKATAGSESLAIDTALKIIEVRIAFGVTTADTVVDLFDNYMGGTVFNASNHEGADTGAGKLNPEPGTVAALTHLTDTNFSNPRGLFIFNSELYFVAENSSDETFIWRRTNGLNVVATDIELDDSETFSVAGDSIFFVEKDSGEVWKYSTEDTTAPQFYTSATTAYTASEFALFDADQLVVISAQGSVVNRHLDSNPDISTSGIVNWDSLAEVILHDGSLALVNQIGNRYSLWEINGLQASSLVTGAVGETISGINSVGDAVLYTSTTTNTPSLYSVESGESAVLRHSGSTGGSYESFARIGADVYFFYSEIGKNELRTFDASSTSGTSTLIKDLGKGTVSNLVTVDGKLYVVLGTARGTNLWYSDTTAIGTEKVLFNGDEIDDPSGLTVFGDSVFFLAPNQGDDGVLWSTDGVNADNNKSEAKPFEDFVLSSVPALNIYMVPNAGDGLVDASDADLLDHAVLIANTEVTSNASLVDITELIRSMLSHGITRVTFLLQLPADLADPVTLTHAHADNGTRLEVVTGSSNIVTGSLFTEDGRLLQSGQPVIDMSQLTAGTYFLRVESPAGDVELKANGIADVETVSLVTAGDYTYFLRNDNLWRTNGILTAPVTTINASGRVVGVSAADLKLLAGAGDRLFFTIGTGVSTRLWLVEGHFATELTVGAGEITAAVDDAIGVGDHMIFRIADRILVADATTITEIEVHTSGTNFSALTAAGDRAVYKLDDTWYAADATSVTALDSIDAGVQDAGTLIAVDNKLYYFVEADGQLTLWRGTPGEGQDFGAEPLKVAALSALDVIDYKLLGAFEGLVLFTVTVSAGGHDVTSLWTSNGLGDPLLGGQVAGTIQIVADLGGEAGFVTVNDDVFYFTVTATDDGVISLWSSEGDTTNTAELIAHLPGTVQSQVVLEDTTYFIAGPTNTRILWKLTDDGVEIVSFLPRAASLLTVAGGQLAFTARTEGVYGVGPSLWVSDGTADGTRMVIDLTPVQPGNISHIAHTDNGIVFIVRNDDAIVEGVVDYSLWISNGYRDGTYQLISSNAGSWGFGTVTQAPELLRVVGSVAFYLYQGDVYATDGSPAGTVKLDLPAGVEVAETVASDGTLVLLTEDGELYISKGNLVGLPFRIEAKAPLQGNNHGDSDRDLLIGGEGEDILVGNGDHDRLFGNSGDDFFVGEASEIRDRVDGEFYALPPTAQFSVQQPRQPDAEVYIPDLALRAAIASALGIPVTVGFDGRPVIHGTIMASQLATLVELQANNLGIQNVVGLHFARNLKVLNLNGNRIADLSILVPATDPITGARTGLSNLQVFSMDYNGMGILTFGEGDELVEVDADINEIQSTITFWFRVDPTTEAQGLFSMDNGSRGEGGLDRSIYLDAAGNLVAYLFPGNALPNEVIRSSGTAYDDGNWHHVALVFSADGAGVPQTLYVDGGQVAQGTVTSSGLSVQDGINFGFTLDENGNEVWLEGDLDEVRIWDQAFSVLQVNADMVQGYPAVAERVYLVGYWSFDGPSTAFAQDHSLFGRNGLLGGGNLENAPAFNRMQPDLSSRPAAIPELNGLGARDTLFQTVIRDLGRLNIPGPLTKLSLAYTRVDVLDAISSLPDLTFVNLTGAVTPSASTLATVVNHTGADAISKLIEAKDGTDFVVTGDRTLVISAGTWSWRRLTVGGGVDLDEDFTLTFNAGNLVVSAFDVDSAPIDVDSFDQIVFDGGNGDDRLTIVGDPSMPIYAVGGAGDDYIEGGNDESYLFGGTGHDTLVADSGTTFLFGGSGNDTYVFSDAWGTATVSEILGRGDDTLDFSAVTSDLEVNLRGTTTTTGGTVSHLANSIENVVGGSGSDTLNLHRDIGGVIELYNGSLTWDGVVIAHSDIEIVDVRLVDAEGERVGVVRVLEDQNYDGLDLRLEARSIDIRASMKASGLSLRSDSILGIRQDFSALSGLGRVITLEVDKLRIEAAGGVGDVDVPLYVKADVIEALTQGAASIYLVQWGDAVIGDVEFSVADGDDIGATTAGLSTGAGGDIHLVNLFGAMTINEAIEAAGGRIVLTTESIDINATISSRYEVGDQLFRGSLILQPLSVSTRIDMATAAPTAALSFHLSADEINLFMAGFNESEPSSYLVNGKLVTVDSNNGIIIGRADGRHAFTLDAFTYTESFTFRSPVPFGGFDVIGQIELMTSLVDGDEPTLTYLGWRYVL